jgi:hypothetical protein
MILLAFYYFLSVYFRPDLNSIGAIVAGNTIGIASAVAVMALLFTLLKLTGATQLLLIAALTLIIALVVLSVTAIIRWERTMIPYLVRATFFGYLTGSTFYKLLLL